MRCGLDARRFPLHAHRFDLGRAHPQRVLAHFARGVLLLQLGRVFALLARPRRPGQVDRKHQRHHVGVGRAADGIRDFRAPVRQLRRAGDVRLGRGDRLLRAGEMDFRLRLDVGQARGVERQARDVGRVAQGPVGVGADVPGERDARTFGLHRGLRRAVAQLEDSRLGGDELGLRCLAGTVSGHRSRHDQIRLGDLLRDQALGFSGVSAREPRGGRLAPDGEGGHLDGRCTPLGIAQHPLRLQFTLFGARELLHQADPRHRHEIAGERPRVGPFRRNVLDAELEFGVGQFARGSCHLARGFDHRALRSQLRRPRHREPDRLGQRQRIGCGPCGRHRDDGEDGGGQQQRRSAGGTARAAMPASGRRTGRVANAGVATCDLHQNVERTGARSSVPVSDKRGDQIRRWPYRRTIGGPAECGAGSSAEGDAAAASAASESAGTGIGANITGGRSTAVAGVAPSLQCTSHRLLAGATGGVA